MSVAPQEWRLRAESDMWTGSVPPGQPGSRANASLLMTTGVLGSLRWWYEVLVRGLGGSACDPTGEGPERCPDRDVNLATEARHHCAVCALFGCTGWARRFRFEVRHAGGGVQTDQVKRGNEFALRFTPLREVAPEEWALLDVAIRLIAGYGALGGKTVYKPSDQSGRQGAEHHKDYGLVTVVGRPDVEPQSRVSLANYVRGAHWRRVNHKDFAWASLTNFWCVQNRHLMRTDTDSSTFNQVVGRRQAKVQAQGFADDSPATRWLAGEEQVSKKVFSFRRPERTYGFVSPGIIDLTEMQQRLETVWGPLRPDEMLTGEAVLAQLLPNELVAR